jgi:ELWxxDGT repeat protein
MRFLRILPNIFLLFLSNMLFAQTTQLGTFDIGRYNYFYPRVKIKMSDKIFFTGRADTKNGTEQYDLWVSDGTPAGTKALNIKRLYADNIEHNDSLIFYRTYNNLDNGTIDLWQLNGRTLDVSKILSTIAVSNPIVTKELLYFTARDISTGSYLYSFNVKTQKLNKIAPSTPIYENIYQGDKRYAFNDKVLLYWTLPSNNTLFVANELWRTDGTAQGTYRLDTSRTALLNLYSFKDKFYFNQREFNQFGEGVYNAWETDGQTKATKLTQKFNFSNGIWTERGFIGNALDSIHGTDLWFSDFTPNGAQNIGDLDTARYGVFKDGKLIFQKIGSYPRSFAQLNNKVYFFAYNDSCSLAFYETDGTKTGTKLVKPLAYKKDRSYEENARRVFQANGKIYAEVLTPQYGNEIMVSDGTTEGTKILDIWKGGGNSYYWESLRFVDFTDKNAYLVANNGVSGTQIWQIDSTNTVKRISNIANKITRAGTFTIGSINNKMLFTTQRDSLLSIALYDETKPASFQENIERNNYKWLTSFGNIGYTPTNIQLLAQSADNQQNTIVLGKYDYRFFAFYDTSKLLVRNTKNTGYSFEGNLFLAKYDSLGKLSWSKDLFSGTTFFGNRKSITTDEEGNIYVLAQQLNQNSFDNKVFIDSTLIHIGSGKVSFILKFDANGRFLWFKKVFMSFSDSDFLDIVVKDKNIYVTGKNESNSSIDNMAIPTGLFAIKLSETGKVLWTAKLNTDSKIATSDIAIDNMGNLISVDNQGIVSKLKSDNGGVLWTKKLLLNRNIKMTTQSDGSIFILTGFTGSTSFDNKTVTTSKPEGLAIVGLTPKGDVLTTIVMQQDKLVLPLHFSTDDNNVFKIIYYREKTEEPILIFPNWNINNRRSIIAKQITATGLEIARREVFTRTDEINTLKANFDKNDDVIFSGQNITYVDTLSNIPLSDRNYFILSRFSLRGQTTEPKDKILTLEDISLSPNPATNLLTLASKDGDFADTNVFIYNILGQLESLKTTQYNAGIKVVDVSNLNKGAYIIVIQNGDKLLTKKFTKL